MGDILFPENGIISWIPISPIQIQRMVLISSTWAILIIVIIVAIAILVAWWQQTYERYDRDSFHTFISVLAGLGVFVTFLFYYNLIQLQEQQQELVAIQELSGLADNTVNGMLNAMNTASTIIPSFVMSLTPLTNTICYPGSLDAGVCTVTPADDPTTPQTCTEKMTLSYRIFSLWQDTLFANKYIESTQTAYITNFLQRANSQALYQQWLISQINFNPRTQTFGNLLFTYGLPITDQTPAAYTTAATQLMQDPQYQSLWSEE